MLTHAVIGDAQNGRTRRRVFVPHQPDVYDGLTRNLHGREPIRPFTQRLLSPVMGGFEAHLKS
jgi:hypothetical protein